MSRRSIGDYILRGFMSRDKASVTAVIQDAEAALAKRTKDQDDHDEPDGDEGGGDKHTIVNIHNHHEGDDDDKDKAPVGDSGKLGARVARLEKDVQKRFTSLDKKLDRVLDSITGKDGDLPPWLAKKGDDDKGDDDKGDDDKGDDDKGDDDKKDTDDDLPTGHVTGAQESQDPPGVEAELMEADPALKTGPSKMGDSAYLGRLSTAFKNLVQETRARAEILAPGIKFPTMDAAQGPKVAGELLCGIRRAALAKAIKDQRTGPVIGNYLTADGIKSMSCDAVRYAFMDASDKVRGFNNASGRPSEATYSSDGDPRAFRDAQSEKIRQINARNHEFWAKHGGLGPQGSVH
jgi:hypothetical protein